MNAHKHPSNWIALVTYALITAIAVPPIHLAINIIEFAAIPVMLAILVVVARMEGRR